MPFSGDSPASSDVHGEKVAAQAVHLFGIVAQHQGLPPGLVRDVLSLSNQPTAQWKMDGWAKCIVGIADKVVAIDEQDAPQIIGLKKRKKIDILQVRVSQEKISELAHALKGQFVQWEALTSRRLKVTDVQKAKRKKTIWRRDSLICAGKSVIASSVSEMCIHEAAVIVGSDRESVRRMRIGAHRVAQALKAFGPAFNAGTTESLQTELKRLDRALDRVEELDILESLLEHYASGAGLGDGDEFHALKLLIHRQRGPCRGALVRVLKGRPYGRWLDVVAELVNTDNHVVVAKKGDRPVGFRAKKRLKKQLASLLEWRKKLAHDTGDNVVIAQYTKLYSDVRGLRHTLEIFFDLIPKSGAELLSRTTELEDSLGDWQDTQRLVDRLEMVPEGSEVLVSVLESAKNDLTLAQVRFRSLWAEYTTRSHRRRQDAILERIKT